jgi:hypothetical protein
VKLIVRVGAVGNIAFWAWDVSNRPPADALFTVTLKPLMALVTEKFQATDHSPVVALRHFVGRPTRLASIVNVSTVCDGATVAEAARVGTNERAAAATAMHRALRVRIID